MASAGSSAIDFQSFHLDSTIPLRESKANLGPFRATQIYNELIEHMKNKVELKRRRYKMRRYDNCFTGTDAVDVVLHYLLSDKETFSTDLSREKAVKVCQMLMNKKEFLPVGSSHDPTKQTFEDSGGKLYSFPASNIEQENQSPTPDDSDDDSLYDVSDLPHPSLSHSARLSYPLESLVGEGAPFREADCGSLSSRSSRSSGSHNSSPSSLGSLSDFNIADDASGLSREVVEETWKEVALAQLTTIIDLTFLDGVLACDRSSKRQQQPRHNLIISNTVAKHWHHPITASVLNLHEVGLEQDRDVMTSALQCLDCLPKGFSMVSEHSLKKNDSNSKRLVFDVIRKHYLGASDTVLPARLFDLHMAILNLILQNQDSQALKALRLDMVLLPQHVREELHRLLKFMTALAYDESLVLDPSDNNEVVALREFSNSIFSHKLLAPNLGSMLVQFMMQHVHKMFCVPRSLRDKVNLKLYQIRSGQHVPDSDSTYCQRVSKEEYVRQAKVCTQDALVALVNSFLDDTKVTLKEKKQRLKQFQKSYPTLYQQHFAGLK